MATEPCCLIQVDLEDPVLGQSPFDTTQQNGIANMPVDHLLAALRAQRDQAARDHVRYHGCPGLAVEEGGACEFGEIVYWHSVVEIGLFGGQEGTPNDRRNASKGDKRTLASRRANAPGSRDG